MPRTVLLTHNTNTPPPHTSGTLVLPSDLATQLHPHPAITLAALAQQQLAVSVVDDRKGLLMLQECATDVPGIPVVNLATLQLIRELMEVQVAPHQLGIPEVQSDWVGPLLRRYQAKLEEQHLLDPAQMYWWAARSPLLQQEVHLRGFVTLTPGQVVFLKSIAAEGSTLTLPDSIQSLFQPNHDLLEEFNQDGWEVVIPENPPSKIAAWTTNLPFPLQISSCQDVLTEMRMVFSQIHHNLVLGESPEDHLVVLPAPQVYHDALQAISWEYGIACALLTPRGMLSRPLGTWLNLGLSLLQGEDSFENLFSFHSHPLAGGIPVDALRNIRRQQPSSLKAWSAYGLHALLDHWPEQADFATFMGIFQDRVVDVFERHQTQFSSLDEAALSQLLVGLAQQAESTVEPDLPRNVFLSTVQDLMKYIAVGDTDLEGKVLVIDASETPGVSRVHVFVLGLMEGIAPPYVREPHIFDLFTRKHLKAQGVGVQTAVDMARKHQQQHWSAFQAATKTLHLSMATTCGNETTLPSPLVHNLSVEVVEVHPILSLSVEEQRIQHIGEEGSSSDSILQKARFALKAEQERHSAESHGVYDGHLGVPYPVDRHLFSATQLTRLGQCPFRWFAQHVLNVYPPEDIRDELQVHERGKFYHLVLENILGKLLGKENPAHEAPGLFDWAFEEAEKHLHLDERPLWPRQRSEHHRHLQNVVQSDAFLPEGHVVWKVEHPFETLWQGVKVKGVMDRIDQTPEGYQVWDYKTSSSVPKGVKGEEGKLNVDIQLPLYLDVLGPTLPDPDVSLSGQYFSITKSHTLLQVGGEETHHQKFLEHTLPLLTAGHFPVDPDPEGKACDHCDFPAVCRQGNRLNRKREHHAHP